MMKQLTNSLLCFFCLCLLNVTVQAQTDLELTINQQTPGSSITQFQNHIFILTVKNTGTTAATNVTVQLPEPDDRGIKINGGFSLNPEAGTFIPEWNGAKNIGSWVIPTVNPGDEVFMNVVLYVGVAPAAINVFAQITDLDQSDCDSTPNDKTCCGTVTEDDEVLFPSLPNGSIRGSGCGGSGGSGGSGSESSVWTQNEDNSIFYSGGSVGIGVSDPDAGLEIVSDQTNLSLGGVSPSISFKYKEEGLNYSSHELRSSMTALSLTKLDFSVTDSDIIASSLLPIVDFATKDGTFFHENISAPKLITDCITVEAPISFAEDLVSINNLGGSGARPRLNSGYGIHLDLDGKLYTIGAHGVGRTGGIEASADRGIAGYFESLSGHAIIVPNGNVGIGTDNPTSELTVKTDIRSLNSDNNTATLIYAGSKSGSIRTYGENRSTNFWATHTSNNLGYAGIYNSTSRSRAYLTIGADVGIVRTFGTNNRENAQITYVSGSPNHGYILVEDGASVQQAGMYVDSRGRGIVFADTKNFRIPHPEKSGKEIWYASLEGPEAAAYERGTAKLRNGEAFVEFSDHFKLVINGDENMTVIVTPHSADTYGLAVIEKTAEGVRVKELMNRKGNFTFDWEVKGVRKGHEKYRVIRNADEVQPGTVDEDVKSMHHALPVEEERTTTPTTTAPPKSPVFDEQQQHRANAWLGQSTPNPADVQVNIPFFIEESVQDAFLQIMDTNGNILDQITITQREKGQIELQLDVYPSGNYYYTLVLDGKYFESHQIAVTH